MENLNKIQIVLLTLLVSFVTSIATGIVTVTLLDQAPPGVTQTINRIVERTIETVIPGENQVTTVVKEIIIREEDLIVDAVEKSSKSMVKIMAIDNEGKEVALGMGLIISGSGYFITDKNRIAGNHDNLVVKYAGVSLSATVVSGEDDELAVLQMSLIDTGSNEKDTIEDSDTEDSIEINKLPVFVSASLSNSDMIRLGQTVLTFGGDSGNVVEVGIVSKIEKISIVKDDTDEQFKDESIQDENMSEEIDYIITNIVFDEKSSGGPLINTSGDVLGVNILDLKDETTIITIPINRVKEIFSNIINSLQDEVIATENG